MLLCPPRGMAETHRPALSLAPLLWQTSPSALLNSFVHSVKINQYFLKPHSARISSSAPSLVSPPPPYLEPESARVPPLLRTLSRFLSRSDSKLRPHYGPQGPTRSAPVPSAPIPCPLPFAGSALATRASSIFSHHTRPGPASGFLHWLFPLLEHSSPNTQKAYPLIVLRSPLKGHLLRDLAFPDHSM